ncbi:MAG: lysylphosphatidylglycerol synthase domain-containing protein [Pseudodesulfovibrio sp.]
MSKKIITTKRLFHLLGYVVVGLSMVYLAQQIFHYAPFLTETLLEKKFLTIIPAAGAAYALLFSLLALGWHILLKGLCSSSITPKQSFYIYARSSIAKYLPGNIGHFVGRHFIAKNYSLAHDIVASTTVLEILCQICAASAITLWADLPLTHAISPVLAVALTSLILLVAPLLIIRLGKAKQAHFIKSQSVIKPYITIIAACLLAGIFFLATGGIVYILAEAVGANGEISIIQVISIYSVAWFAGLITPGAPAGIGVREAIMITLLSPYMGNSQALVVAVLFRIITSVGDVLFFLCSYIPGLKDNQAQKQPGQI